MAGAHTVVIIANTAWNIYNFRRSLYKHLTDNGYEVITMGMPDPYALKLHALGIRFIPLNALIPSQISWLRDLNLVKELRLKLQSIQPDILLLYTAKPNIYGNYVASRLDIPTISTLTGIGSVFTLGGWRAKGISKMYKLALKKTNQIVFHNEDDLELFSQRSIITDKAGCVIPGSGINTDEIALSPISDNGTMTFLLMSRMIEDKGIRSFIEASERLVKEIEDIRFVMIGDRPELDERTIPEREITRWSSLPRCNYHRFEEDVFPFIREASVVVLPSWREGMPRVVLEAMASGRPVIASDVPGCRQAIVEGQTGFLVQARSASALYEGMLKAYRMTHSELSAMGMAGRKRVEEHFHSKRINEAYLQLIQDILP